MNLAPDDYQIFNREIYAFKQLKQLYNEDELAVIKADYKNHWDQWKTIQLATWQLLPQEMAMPKPKIESWTNGWNLRSHFWSAYRSPERQKENACLAVLLNKKQYQIYLMFQHYKSDERNGSVAEYNRLLQALPSWAEQIDISDYYIWPQLEHELTDHLPLKDYLADEGKQVALKEAMGDRSFQIGKLFYQVEIPEIEQVTARTLQELAPLYEMIKAR